MTGKSGYLLDTNVLSELRKKKPEPRVIEFIQECDETAIFTSVLTVGELHRGVLQKRRSDAAAAKKLGVWVDDLQSRFGERIVGVDEETALKWGEFSADRPRAVVDTLLAATAARHNLILVTRNTRDLRGLKVEVLNPWKG